MKAHLCLLGLIFFCSACGAPSLRYKTQINQLTAQGQFKEAAQQIEKKKKKLYQKKDEVLFELDRASLLHDAQDPAQSDLLFASAQARISESYAKSISGTAGQFLLNDWTAPYSVPAYEQALTYYYRAQNFLQQGDVSSAAV
mgnify:CR=1 FL=1